MNKPFPRTFPRRAVLAAVAVALAPTFAAAQAVDAWPDKPVKLIVPFTAGGPTDTVARLIAIGLQAAWKQPVVVDYKPGAGTMLGTGIVAKSPADGYTLGMAITALTINPSLQPNLSYDTRKDLVGVSQVAQAHFGLFAHPSQPFNTMAELIAYAKKNPTALSFATPGAGTGTHLAGEMLSHMAGIRMVHVPYKGSAPAQQDVIGGRVPLLFDVLFSSMPFVKDSRMKLIALSSPKRALSNPEVPLIAETVPGFSAVSVIGIIAPAGLPPALLHKISADIGQVVRSAEVTARMQQLGMEPVGSTAEQYTAQIRQDIDKWAAIVKTAGIKID
ncbi:MAG: tripartite tricarboxylate transporter substrate binding protein [Ramlibacter sp.]|jgi:tripartite-type tricarboxylate transporter receptor subunit TctC|uniref:tripartite tricarboxylate transporter substrate binding protein n=1 Tax=Ramlibacter sp. TaxID=1917967 RepID=UPI00260E0856|nr:tripartite tricarboxylate transporter substrate binding protein [Ramlibacter sp.]MDB5750968.1 tripartite tricarboxylate transporter substrate binding protein [Ramlibacter sp.]